MQCPDAITAITSVVAELERLRVPYYVGGSIASSAYGFSRATIDADLIADLGPDHVVPLVGALEPVYYVSASAIAEAISRKSCFNLIHLPTSFKVDVFAVKNRPYDRAAIRRIRKDSLAEELPSVEFFLASPEDVVLSKLEWFRLGEEVAEQQWRDVIGVLKVQANSLDREYLANWAAELEIADLLEKAWRETQI